MAPPRPYWKGYLKLSLVSCPVAVYSAASSSERIAFRQINRETGNRLKQQLIDEETGDVVEAADKARGYEVSRQTYMTIEDDEINSIAIESNHTIDIDRFVPLAEIDERYLDSPYYLVPEGKVGLDAFAVIREAMRGKDLVALGRIVLAKRERVVMLQAWDKGIMATTLRYAYEVRDQAAFFDDIADVAVAPDMLQLAEHILASKAGQFDPSQFKDRYEEAVIAMLKAKQAGKAIEQPKQPDANRNVVNLMDALKRSLGGAAPTLKPAEVLKPKKAKKRVQGQGEMLLPIAGKGPPRQAPNETTKPARQSSGRKAG